MKFIHGTAFAAALVLTAAAQAGVWELDDGPPAGPAWKGALFELASALGFAECGAVATDGELVPDRPFWADLAQPVLLAMLDVPPHARQMSCGPPPEDKYDDALQETSLALCNLLNPNERIRARSIEDLHKHGLKLETKVLVQVVRKDPSPLVRETAARSLGLIDTDSLAALDALRRAAKEDSSPEVRRTARFAAEIVEKNLGRERAYQCGFNFGIGSEF